MKHLIITIVTVMVAVAVPVRADSSLSVDDLLTIAKLSVTDFAKNNPEMAKMVTAFKVSTAGQDGRVKITMDHGGGMTMDSNYFCAKTTAGFECREQ